MDPEASKVPVDLSSFEDAGIPADAFGKVQDMFSSADFLCPPQPPRGCGGGGPSPPPPRIPKPSPAPHKAPHKSGSPPLPPPVEVSFKLQHWMISRIPFYTCGFNLSRMGGSMFVKNGW
ncbi:unnamed protein product [Lactuca virosa]|uniref:Uncharacterized protein n=1 Tax=Lactuca virosa TaxID=75947 RepID=A0AAU9N4I5_9ASTR|nr:unnamed protein product [Lactuca virosa]